MAEESCKTEEVAVSQMEQGGTKAEMDGGLGTHLGWIRQWGFLWRPLHSESITENKE